jgi:transposase
VLEVAPTPAQGRSLSSARITAALKRSGRRRRITERTEEIKDALRSPQLEAPAVLTGAYGDVVRSTVRIVAEITAQIGELGGQLDASFEGHPDTEILNSLPGLGMVLCARERPAAGLGSRRGGCRA